MGLFETFGSIKLQDGQREINKRLDRISELLEDQTRQLAALAEQLKER
jgi:hypothetical protein